MQKQLNFFNEKKYLQSPHPVLLYRAVKPATRCSKNHALRRYVKDLGPTLLQGYARIDIMVHNNPHKTPDLDIQEPSHKLAHPSIHPAPVKINLSQCARMSSSSPHSSSLFPRPQQPSTSTATLPAKRVRTPSLSPRTSGMALAMNCPIRIV